MGRSRRGYVPVQDRAVALEPRDDHGFQRDVDTIKLENAIFKALPAGALASSAFFVGAQAHDANDRIIYNSATGALLYDPDGTGSQAAAQFATMRNAPALTYTDFVVI